LKISKGQATARLHEVRAAADTEKGKANKHFSIGNLTMLFPLFPQETSVESKEGHSICSLLSLRSLPCKRQLLTVKESDIK
jgi:hypothetical protein